MTTVTETSQTAASEVPGADLSRPSSYYKPGEHHAPENEIHRLRQQVAASWQKEARVLREFGLTADADVLEIGPGPGYITERLLEEIPDGTLTALELNEDLIEHARGHLAPARPDQLTLVQGSVLESGLPDESYDLALARLVLQHVPNTPDALAEIHRTLRPGGKLVVTDVDDALWGLLHPQPDLPEFDEVVRLRIQLQAGRGGNRLIGRELGQLMKAAGFTDIKVEAIAISSEEVGMDVLAPQLNIRSRTAAMVAVNPAAQRPCEVTADAMDEFLARPDASMMLVFFMFSGTKPAGDAR
ncbi:class I SAM-dependent methyltransferase [Streptomyces globisporus]|uniref:class I SAM-dependent methyltransferase n=1 Tax=Streptomyces globisporus TaxID=1908 RepID=UPI0004C791A4|nr:class I SAM-dependent methyltransferase [Streptomyces globisporus]